MKILENFKLFIITIKVEDNVSKETFVVKIHGITEYFSSYDVSDWHAQFCGDFRLTIPLLLLIDRPLSQSHFQTLSYVFFACKTFETRVINHFI